MNTLRGYVAVASAVITSFILTLAVFTSGTSVFIARFGEVDSENKTRSKILAFSCVYEVLYAYAEAHSYATQHQTIEIGQTENGTLELCTIDAITTNPSGLTIDVHASLFDSYTALEVQAGSNPLTVTSWHEITSIPP